ncbi:ABC-three component system middle component 1 [Photobacterium kasasachensis]|uniref:ABC-three component system middle component 1 n=1 Tax=Photobacterium kasasachensis TaxID=2910240 RepID=UPI003D0EBAB8
MKALIHNTFILNRFIEQPISDLSLYSNCDPKVKNYWLVLESNPEHVMEIQSELIDLCVKETKDRAVEKNINILCLWKINSFNDDINKSIQELEEDPYFFKKHVLCYTQKELSELNYEVSKNTLQHLLDEQLTSPEVFDRYKEYYDRETWQSLLYRIAIKASFIRTNTKNLGDISNLKTDIYNKINSIRNDSELISDLNQIILDTNVNEVPNPTSILDEIIKNLKENGHEF